MIQSVDTNRNGVINFTEFITLLLTQKYEEENARLRREFDHWDTSGTGLVTIEDLTEAFRERNADLTESEIASSMRALDMNGDGATDFEEFKSFMQEFKEFLSKFIHLAYFFEAKAIEIYPPFPCFQSRSSYFVMASCEI